MTTVEQIRPGMAVIDSAGVHLGIVDHVHDDIVEMTREGFADDLHHFVSLAAVKDVNETAVVVDQGQATTVEAIAGAILYSRRRSPATDAVFGTSGHGTGDGGPGIGH